MTKIFSSIVALSAAALFVLSSAEAGKGKHGQIASVESAEDFCFFLPPKMGVGTISENEDKAIAFCTKELSGAPGAKIFPEGFIESAHFKEDKEKNWVQVTGKIAPKLYAMSKKDGGGQYDVKAPVGAMCANYNYFVNMVEPDGSIYCIRCCETKEDCPVGKSTYGCKAVIDGTY